MAQSYPLTVPELRVTVNGTVRDTELRSGTTRVSAVLGDQIDRAFFSIKKKETFRGTAGAKPVAGQSVLIERREGSSAAWITVFGGLITRVRETKIAYKAAEWNCECLDYTTLMQRIQVNQVYQRQEAANIVKDVVQRFAPYISTSGVETTGIDVGPLTFAARYPAQAVADIAKLTGHEWFVDPARVLQFRDPTKSIHASAQTVTDTSANFDNLVIEPQLDQVRNRIYVVGGKALSAEIVEHYDATGDEGGTFFLQHGVEFAEISENLVDPTDFMTIDGIPQIVALQGVTDEADVPVGGFMLYKKYGLEGAGQVRTPSDRTDSSGNPVSGTAIVAAGSKVVFRYKTSAPVNVVQEDRASQDVVSLLDGMQYGFVVSGDGPLYHWRMNEMTGTSIQNVGSAGLSASGFVNQPAEYSNLNPLTGLLGRSMAFFGEQGDIRGASDAPPDGTNVHLLPSGAAGYALEAWVKCDAARRNEGILGAWRNSTNRGASQGIGATLYIDSNGYYGLRHMNLLLSSTVRPTGTDFDHVVGSWDGLNFGLWVNKDRRPVAVTTGVHDVPASGIQIGDYDYDAATYGFTGWIAEPAVYSQPLTPRQVAEHHDSGRWAGVREMTISEPTWNSFEQAREGARRAITRYANLITNLSWTSDVPGWNIGETVTVNVTEAGMGRTFNSTALIQSVDHKWYGAQRARFSIQCMSSKFDWIDYLKSLHDPGLSRPGRASTVTHMRSKDTTAILVGGSETNAFVTPPYLVKPNWGAETTPVIQVERWTIDPDWG